MYIYNTHIRPSNKNIQFVVAINKNLYEVYQLTAALDEIGDRPMRASMKLSVNQSQLRQTATANQSSAQISSSQSE